MEYCFSRLYVAFTYAEFMKIHIILGQNNIYT